MRTENAWEKNNGATAGGAIQKILPARNVYFENNLD